MVDVIDAQDSVNLSDDLIQRYEQDGVVCLRKAFSDAWVERLRKATEDVLGGATRLSPEGDGGSFLADRFMWSRHPDFRAFAFESPTASIARSVMRSSQVRFYFDHLFVKEPGAQAPTPWHHDQPYWPVRGRQVASIWLTLDPVTLETGGLEYVKGSHLWDKRFEPETFKSGADQAQADSSLDRMPDLNAERDKHDFLTWDMEPGDCLVFQSLIVHGAAGNSSRSTRRRAISTRWLGDDATYDPPADPDAGLYDPGLAALLDETLQPGGPMTSDKFPSVL